ncbi:MAG: polysaccharide biosynthesis protein [Verrucomicrobiia bacterium]
MIELSGLRPGIDIEIVFTAPRPGEKLFEELCYNKEKHIHTKHPKIWRFTGKAPPYEQITSFLTNIKPYLYNGDSKLLKERLHRIIPEYTPQIE